MVFETKGKVVLVTGAAGGIGAGVVRAFLAEGAKHVAILDVADGKSLEEELNAKYGEGKAKYFKCDVTDDSQLFNAFDVTTAEQGYIDVVINNAGIMNDNKNIYKKQIEVNVTALVTGTIKAIEVMRKDKGGKGGAVINMSSIAGLNQFDVLPIYFATKSAVIQFSNCIGMGETYERTGVRVVTICFGVTDTSLFDEKKMGTVDEDQFDPWLQVTKAYPKQKVESAVRGVLDAYKYGESASTWLADGDRKALDITENIKDGYNSFSSQMWVPN